MAFPRLFVSSTFYDLRFVRADLSVLQDQMALEVVRFETGAIPYHTADTLPDACCKEIDTCNIMVSIIGGRYGSVVTTKHTVPGQDQDEREDGSDGERIVSVSRLEVERAVSSGLLLFTFVDSEVLSEHRFFDKNRQESKSIRWSTVDSVEIFTFIDFIKGLPGRNPIFGFRTPTEIQQILRDQLSGVLCDFLERQRLTEYSSHLDQIIRSSEKLQLLQQELREREREAERQIREMRLPDHPFYTHLREQLNAPFRLYFKNFKEMSELLDVLYYVQVNPNEIQKEKTERMVFFRSDRAPNEKRFLGLCRKLFPTEDTLVLPPSDEWTPEVVWLGDKI